MDPSKSESVPEAVGARTTSPGIGARSLALAPAAVLLIVLSFVQVTSQSGAGGYDAIADWVTVNAAFDGLDLSMPVVTLAEHYGVTLEGIGGHEESVHPRTPGGLLAMSSLALVEPDLAYPLWVAVGAVSTVILMLWVVLVYPLSQRDAVVGSLLVVSAGYVVSGSLEFGSLSPLVALLAFAFWRGVNDDCVALEGLALGVAASLKIYPSTLLLAVVAMQRWRLVAWAALSVVLLNVAGLILIGDYSIWSYLDMLSVAAQQWIPFSGNLSVAGLLAGLGMASTPASLIGLLVAVAFVTLLWNRANPGYVLSLVVVATVVGWPMAWGHYMLLAIPAVAWFAQGQGSQVRWLAVAWLVGWVVLPPTLTRLTFTAAIEQVALASLQLLLVVAVWQSHRRHLLDRNLSGALAPP